MARRSLFSYVSFASACAVSLLFAACGPSAGNGDDDETDDPLTCSGDDTRCSGGDYQECQDGVFETVESCFGACNPDLGGCVECDPDDGNACDGNNVVACNSDGTFGSVVTSCPSGCSLGECTQGCSADGVDVIYVVDDAYRLLSFDPRLIGSGSSPYQVIGQLSCPNPGTALGDPLSSPATPFSMSVDRDAVAWVLYSSGKIFKVSTADASCQATSFAVQQNTPPQVWNLFGMGFVTETAGGDSERLWIGGGDLDGMTSGSLGWIDPGSLAVTRVASIGPDAEYSAEFTGLGDATLWAFFPDTTNQAFIQQIDKATGAGVGSRLSFDLAASGNQIQAWAFAQWGGKFYVFVTTTDFLGIATNATVHEVDRTSGAHRVVLNMQPYVVVGAGVSTCAPVVIGRE